jgi:hypothetical protein
VEKRQCRQQKKRNRAKCRNHAVETYCLNYEKLQRNEPKRSKKAGRCRQKGQSEKFMRIPEQEKKGAGKNKKIVKNSQ